jgi:hypothetical protein
VTQPTWLAGPLAAVMIATAVYCSSRLALAWRAHRAAERGADATHAIMGVSMSGMLVTRLDPLPNGAWALLFGVAAVWFGWQVWRRAGAHHVPHLVMCGAMVYMLLAATAMRPHAMAMGGGGARFPVLALALALAMIACVVWQAERLSTHVAPGATAVHVAAGPTAAHVAPGPTAAHVAPGATAAHVAPGATAAHVAPGATVALSPRLAACCQIAMSLTMGYMLIMMI